VLRAARESETTQENIQYWLQLDEEDPGFEILTEEEIAAVIFFFIYLYRQYPYYKIFLHFFSKFFFVCFCVEL
jgi:hypothetical protein